jgi:phage-related minor tail protein
MAAEFPELDELGSRTEPLRAAMRDLSELADGFGRSMSTAFKRAAVDGRRLEDVLKGLALELSGKALNAAFAPVGRGLSGALAGLLGTLFGGSAFAKGDVIGPMVTPFAQGGVVASPSYFPMRGGLGLMGEAGPEAILPLARGPDGSLGVRAAGRGGGVTVTFNVNTRDADSFRRAEADLTAMLARAVARGQRGM